MPALENDANWDEYWEVCCILLPASGEGGGVDPPEVNLDGEDEDWD